jgi:cell division protein FtsZ
VRTALSDVRTAVVVAALGGGVGSGATPEILRLLRGMGVATICFATQPFGFEGQNRCNLAARGLAQIEEHADATVVVPLDGLFQDAGGRNFKDAIRLAGEKISAGLTLFWRLLLTPGFIRIDVEQLRGMLLQGGGRCRFGAVEASGSDRAGTAVQRLRECALLGSGEALRNAHALALGVLGGEDLRLAELSAISAGVQAACPPGVHVRLGTVLDPRFGDTLHLAALAFETWREPAAKPAADEPVATATVTGLVPPAAPSRTRPGHASKLSFGPIGRGRFRDVEPTFADGKDLDIPTYQRQRIALEP